MITFQEEYINAKYHLTIAKRLYHNYQTYSEKRMLVGVINELAKAVSKTIRTYLLYSKKRTMREFIDVTSKQYLDTETRLNLLKVLEIEKAQKLSPVQFAKKETMILLIGGKYRFLKSERLQEFIISTEKALKEFPGTHRQI